MTNVINKKIKRDIGQRLLKEKGILAAYLFGSYSKGRQRKTSDIDIGILCKSKDEINIPKLAVYIDKLFPTKEVDVVVCDESSRPFLMMQMINGVVLYQRSVADRVALETKALRLFEDETRLNAIKNYYLDRSFKEGIYANR